MTLSNLLSPSVAGATGGGRIQAPDIDRTEWGWNSKGGGGGWKGGKGNPNAALSALTLLAFLFFLNVLQSCLKDSMNNQNPGVVVMMMPTPTVEGARVKREVQTGPRLKNKGKYYNQEWDAAKITELVHSQVESYWSNKQAKPYWREPIKFEQTNKYKPLKDSKDKKGQQKKSHNKISTKLHVISTTKQDQNVKHNPDHKTLNDILPYEPSTEENPMRKEKPPTTSNWIKIVTTAMKMSKPLIRTILCCEAIVCENSQIKGDNNFYSGSNVAIRNILLWFCGGQSQDSCDHNHFTLRDCKNPLVRNLLQNRGKITSDTTDGMKNSKL